MNHDSLEGMSNDELRLGIRKYFTEQQSEEEAPLPSNAPVGLSQVQKETLFDNWLEFIMKKNPRDWTAEEKAAISAGIRRSLKTP